MVRVLGLHIWNQLPKTVKAESSFQIFRFNIGLDLSAGAKLAVIWIVNPSVLLHSTPNLRFDLPYFSFLL